MDKEREFLFLFGVNPVREKLQAAPEEVIEVLIARGHQRAALQSVEGEAERRGRPVRHLESAVLDRLAGGARHQGVVAKIATYSYSSFSDLLRELTSSAECRSILLLDGVTDPRNLGALLRTVEAVGIRHIVIPKHRSVGVTATVAKTSAGAVHYLKIYRVTNLRQAILTLKEKGYWVVGLDAQAKEGIYGRVYPERLAVVLGAEGKGMGPLIRQECDFLVSIPMQGKIASLNVAVSAGVFLYELFRQRGVL